MLLSVCIFVLGCVMGSFFYVAGTRLPGRESLIRPRSHCTFCNHTLNALDLIPVLSYLFLKGKCRYCKKKLSMGYLYSEIFTGLLFFLSYWKFSISYEFYVMLIISSLLVLIFITDFRYMIILDSPLVVSILLLLVLQLIYFDLRTVAFSLLSGLFSFLTLLFIGKVGDWLFKRESLGGGDIKFSFVMGALLGYKYAIVALVFSTFLALPYAVGSMLLNKDNEVPFGPFLASSVAIVYFFIEKFQYLFYFL